MTIIYRVGDVFAEMAAMPDNSVDLVVTSPPFLALRSYLPADHPDKHLEIGSEATPAAYLSTLLRLTREWRRLLTPHGSIAIELGDTYAGSGGDNHLWDTYTGNGQGGRRYPKNEKHPIGTGRRATSRGWPLDKSLCGIPAAYQLSLAYGRNILNPDDEPFEPWRVRNKIVWHRPNPPVGALGDKVRPSTTYITVGCIARDRWFDLDSERGTPTGRTRDYIGDKSVHLGKNLGPYTAEMAEAGAPPLDCWLDGDVWTLPTHPYHGAHYATYPPALPRRLIRLMCPRSVCVVCGLPRRRITETEQIGATPNGDAVAKGRKTESPVHAMRTEARVSTLGWSDCGHNTWRRGHVLDPFAGSGTTGTAALDTGRDATLIDLDPRNHDLARDRLGLFLDVS